MEIRKTRGIVLAARPLGEADVACSILTCDYGKHQFLFKGLRKSRKRPISAKEPGTLISLVYYFNAEKKLSIINECAVVDTFSLAKNDLDRIYHLSLVLETVDKTIAEGIADVKLYKLLEGALGALSATSEFIKFSSFYMIRLLKNQGLFPNDDSCPSCNREIRGDFTISTIDLQKRCGECTESHVSARSRRMKGTMARFINDSLSVKFSSMNLQHYDERECMILLETMVRFIEQYYQVKINSFAFINT